MAGTTGFQLKPKLSRLILVVGVCGLGGLLVSWRYSNLWTPRKLAFITKTVSRSFRTTWKPIIVIDWSGYSDSIQTYLEGNCMVTRDRSLLNQSQAVVITHRKEHNLQAYPKTRHISQRWIWLIDESPYHTFNKHNFGFESIKNTFNWTMTYRTSSDVYIPYGWTTVREKPQPIPKSIGNRTRLVAVATSNCGSVHNGRLQYILELNSSVGVDIYGKCGDKKCSGHVGYKYLFTCAEMRHYLFYIAFENSNCKEYISEKPFNHGFEMGAVPVVMGASKDDYIAITPPNSFIYADDFATPADLGKYLTYLSKNKTEYMKYHEWRTHYTTSYRVHYSTEDRMWDSLCHALRNDIGEPKVYPDLGTFWSTADCSKHWT